MAMKNNEYWQERFVLLEESQNKKSEEYLNILKEEYEKSLSKIEKDITNWYTRLADNNEMSLANAKKLLNKKELQEFKWNVEEYIQKGKENAVNQKWMQELENASTRVHIERLEAIKMQIQNELELLNVKQDKETTDLLKNQYENAYYKSAFEIQKGLEQYWNIQPLNTNQIDKIISKPWTTDNKTFSDRIWNNKENLLNTLQKDLTQATIRGDDIQNIINKIEKDFKVSKNRAGTLVMTESAFFSSVGQKECFSNLGVKKYEIVATLDTHTSQICQEIDGTIFDMKDYETGITAPPFHPNCRTTTVPYFNDEFTESEKRFYRDENGKNGYVDSKMKYKEWKEKYVTNGNNSAIILTNKEQDAINKYISSDFYKINEKLRNNIKLTNTEEELTRNLDNMLDKMPKFTGLVTRSLELDNEKLQAFLDTHKLEEKIEYKAYTSTTCGERYNDISNIELHINSKNGRDIRKYNKEEQEILFERNSKFTVQEIEKIKGTYHILLEEVDG